MQPEPMVVGGVNPAMMTGRPAQMMGFVDAVKNALQNNYVNFSGRASRSEYWWFYLFACLAVFGAQILGGIITAALGDAGAMIGLGIVVLVYLGLVLPNLGVSVRRMHDIGKSGWLLLVAIIPCVGVILLIVWMVSDGEPHDNAYGPVPTNVLAL